MILFLPVAAFAVTVESLPPSGFADTEVLTVGSIGELVVAEGRKPGFMLEVR